MLSRFIPLRSSARSRASYFTQNRSYASRPPPKTRRGVLDIGLLGLTGIAVTATAAYWWSKRQPKPSTFTVATRNTPAITISKLTDAQVDSRLRENEATYTVARTGNPVYRYDTNNVKSNDPIEDYSAVFISSRDKISNGTNGDMMLFGIYDGHSGLATSKRLSEELIDIVINELQSVVTKQPEYVAAVRKFAGLHSSVSPNTLNTFSTSQSPPPPPYFPSKLAPEVSTRLARIWDILCHGLYASHLPYMLSSSHFDDSVYNLETYPPVIHQALKNAFKKLDNDIIYTPVRLLNEKPSIANNDGESNTKPASFIGIDKNKIILPAFSGSCALLAYLDVPHNMLHVACTGDSRAVMGVWEPSPDGSGDGQWKSRVLSEDQQGDNPSEVARIRSEHPPSERDQVILRNRVLGFLAPTRAFGDASYKWTLDIRNRIAEAFDIPPKRRTIPSKTPPYVTAEPEVTTCDLTANRKEFSQDNDKQKKSADRRFVVLATDGLWDRLESEEVVGLVGAWLDGVRESRSREDVLSRVVPSPPGADASSDCTKAPSSRKIPKEFTFVDSNISTHLIRNALGGSDKDTLSVLLAIPAPLSRRYRDDITVTVVLLGDDDGNAKQPSGVRRLFFPSRS